MTKIHNSLLQLQTVSANCKIWIIWLFIIMVACILFIEGTFLNLLSGDSLDLCYNFVNCIRKGRTWDDVCKITFGKTRVTIVIQSRTSAKRKTLDRSQYSRRSFQQV